MFGIDSFGLTSDTRVRKRAVHKKGIFKSVGVKYCCLDTFDLGFGMSIPINDQPMAIGERIAHSSKKIKSNIKNSLCGDGCSGYESLVKNMLDK